MKTTTLKNRWTLIFIFGRDYKETHCGLTSEQAQDMIRITCFGNQDCVNFICFREP